MNIDRRGFVILVTVSIYILVGIFLSHKKASSHDGQYVIITEICPSGCASSGRQWVEIYNSGQDPVDLSGWKFWEGGVNHGLVLSEYSDVESYILEPSAYAIIAQDDGLFFDDYPDVSVMVLDSVWGTLNKSGEEIGLKKGTKSSDFVERFVYTGVDKHSLERVRADGDPSDIFEWKEHPDSSTPGLQNYWWLDLSEDFSYYPVARIIAPFEVVVGESVVLDASDSRDFDGVIVKYAWTIEDMVYEGVVVEYVFVESGEYEIFLTVSDDDGLSTEIVHILVVHEHVDDEVFDTVVINEFMSDPSVGEKEWIELYNWGEREVHIDGYTIHDGLARIATLSGSISPSGFFVVYLASHKLNQSGDLIELRNATGIVLDVLSYGVWNDGDVSDNAPAPLRGYTTARVSDGERTGDDSFDFARTITPTPGAPNVITVQTSSEGQNTNAEHIPDMQVPTFSEGVVVINELVPIPEANQVEFVELYNTTGSEIILDGWILEDGSRAKTMLVGSISGHGFVVIEKPKGNLNNAGDMVVLFDPSGGEIDRVVYGVWNSEENIAPYAPKGTSLVRIPDGRDTDNHAHDFLVTKTITKGTSNVLTQDEVFQEGDQALSSQQVFATGIYLSEILPNPLGPDDENEFIELYNDGNVLVDLSGWKVSDAVKTFTLSNISIAPKGYVVLYRKETGISLNNTGEETVSLKTPDGVVVDSVVYVGPALDDESYARFGDVWTWTASTTPEYANIQSRNTKAITPRVTYPLRGDVQEMLTFDAGKSTHAHKHDLLFTWSIGGVTKSGEVIEHLFVDVGIHSIILTITDIFGRVSESVLDIEIVSGGTSGVGGRFATVDRFPMIVEIMPNPVGPDDYLEYIELYNPYDHEIDIGGWMLDDEEGGSKPFVFPSATVIASHEYQAWYRSDTGVVLNNTTDKARLMDPHGNVVHEVEYSSAKEGRAYVFSGGLWFWSEILTPGAPNPAPPGVSVAISSTGVVGGVKQISTKDVMQTSLLQVRSFDIGTQVGFEGVVIVEPGVLSTQYFYVAGSPGIQIYSHKKDFPALARGDRVYVTGELAESSGEMRVKTKTANDIVIIETDVAYIPHRVDITDIGEAYEGWLVEVVGEVTGIKGSYVYVDDGTDEVRVYIRSGSGIDKSAFKQGMRILVSGIVQETKSGYHISPRDVNDIRVEGDVLGEKISFATNGVGNFSRNDILRAFALLLIGIALILGIKVYGRMIQDKIKKIIYKKDSV